MGRKKVGRNVFSRRSMLLVGLVIFILTLSWLLPRSWNWPKTRGESFILHYFDVGQGDAALVQCGRTQALIDGGPSRSVLRDLGRTMPFTDRQIEYVFLSHPHSDHFFGLFEVLERYQVRYLVLTEHSLENAVGQDLAQLADDRGVTLLPSEAGDIFGLGECGQLKMLWPNKDSGQLAGIGRDWNNDLSQVLELRLADGQPIALFTGDINALSEQELINRQALQPVSLLKVPHHGSRYSSSKPFVQVLAPDYAIISVGENNYSQPGSIVLLRYAASDVTVLRTDQQDAIDFALSPDHPPRRLP
jgi:competence protein ComEC